MQIVSVNQSVIQSVRGHSRTNQPQSLRASMCASSTIIVVKKHHSTHLPERRQQQRNAVCTLEQLRRKRERRRRLLFVRSIDQSIDLFCSFPFPLHFFCFVGAGGSHQRAPSIHPSIHHHHHPSSSLGKSCRQNVRAAHRIITRTNNKQSNNGPAKNVSRYFVEIIKKRYEEEGDDVLRFVFFRL